MIKEKRVAFITAGLNDETGMLISGFKNFTIYEMFTVIECLRMIIRERENR